MIFDRLRLGTETDLRFGDGEVDGGQGGSFFSSFLYFLFSHMGFWGRLGISGVRA